MSIARYPQFHLNGGNHGIVLELPGLRYTAVLMIAFRYGHFPDGRLVLLASNRRYVLPKHPTYVDLPGRCSVRVLWEYSFVDT